MKELAVTVAMLAVISKSLPRVGCNYWFNHKKVASCRGFWGADDRTLVDLKMPDPEDYFWQQVDASYAAMKADPEFWANELAERKAWGV
jgi:hypothetical protein